MAGTSTCNEDKACRLAVECQPKIPMLHCTAGWMQKTFSQLQKQQSQMRCEGTGSRLIPDCVSTLAKQNSAISRNAIPALVTQCADTDPAFMGLVSLMLHLDGFTWTRACSWELIS